jgi:K+-transporting ATPase KdpF subunit
VAGRGAERARRRAMSADNVVGLVLAVFLVVALLNPERF